MKNTTVRSRAAGAVVAASLALAAALAPSATAAPAGAVSAVSKAKPAQVKQLKRIKTQARQAATTKIASYRALRTNQALLAKLPTALAGNVRTHARAQEAKLTRLRTQATNARTVSRAQSVRAAIRSVDSASFASTVRTTAAAFAGEDLGALHDVLVTLLAGPLAGTPLEPSIVELNQLLNELLAGSPDTQVVEEVLALLHGLLEPLTLSPDTEYVELLLVGLHDLLTAVLPRQA